jgi:hypothetical protein
MFPIDRTTKQPTIISTIVNANERATFANVRTCIIITPTTIRMGEIAHCGMETNIGAKTIDTAKNSATNIEDIPVRAPAHSDSITNCY